MPDIKRRDKRQNNGTSFNKPEYGIGRPVGFNQVPGSSSLRLLGAFAHSSHIHAQVDELNSPTTGDDELSLLLSHLLLPLPLSTLTARIGRSSLRRRARITTESFIILSFDVGRKKINSLGYRIFLFQYSLPITIVLIKTRDVRFVASSKKRIFLVLAQSRIKVTIVSIELFVRSS